MSLQSKLATRYLQNRTPFSNRMASGGGDCYEASGKYMMDQCMFSPSCKLILVHGEVMGQGPLEGIAFGHAWILDGNTVIDRSNGRNLKMPKAAYYAMGRISEIGNTHEYTMAQMSREITKSQHWGPWDLKTSTGF